jgi:hypothetical protein
MFINMDRGCVGKQGGWRLYVDNYSHGNSKEKELPKKARVKNSFGTEFSASQNDVTVGYAVA